MLNTHRHNSEALPSGITLFIEICSYSRIFRYLPFLFIRITPTVQRKGELQPKRRCFAFHSTVST